ncbi:MAG: c-type cytochrome [Methyloceanibacter sp.]
MSDLPASRRHWLFATVAAVALLCAIGAAVLYGGLFNVAADVPHSNALYWLLETARERSIAVRATGIVVPDDLADPRRIASGAGQYAEMCSHCHLAPGMKRTEISRGLYPRAPELRRGSHLTPAETFWVVKHGIKMTGMPAWGLTHDDEILWDVVAFLRKLPDLTPDQYRSLVEKAPKTHGETMEGGQMDHMDH